jgi:hypothetical protein
VESVKPLTDAQRASGVIEWWDDPDVDNEGTKGFNTRYYRHLGCDEGNAPWLVPQDGAPPPEGDRECARCCGIFPLAQKLNAVQISALQEVADGQIPDGTILLPAGLLEWRPFGKGYEIGPFLTDSGHAALQEGK